MIRIDCPFCGYRDHSEFTYGRDAAVDIPGLDASCELWVEAVFLRDNIDGMQHELWHHVHGCRMWIVVSRDTKSHKIYSVKPAHHGIKQLLESEEVLVPGAKDT